MKYRIRLFANDGTLICEWKCATYRLEDNAIITDGSNVFVLGGIIIVEGIYGV